MSREVGGIGEIIGVAVAAVVLLVMLGSFVMAGLPLAIAFVGVGVSLTGRHGPDALARHPADGSGARR